VSSVFSISLVRRASPAGIQQAENLLRERGGERRKEHPRVEMGGIKGDVSDDVIPRQLQQKSEG
jgi:hypothetical protein